MNEACDAPMEVSETLVVAFLGVIIVLCWFLVLVLLIFTVKEARRQKAKLQERAEIANREGGVAELLASELHKSLYMTEKMLKCHTEFKSLYDRMPIDYPDAFTINMAKVLQEGRMLEYYNANDEVEQMIRRLFRNEEDERRAVCGSDDDDLGPQMWNVNMDSLRRRLEQLRRTGQTGDVKTSIPKMLVGQTPRSGARRRERTGSHRLASLGLEGRASRGSLPSYTREDGDGMATPKERPAPQEMEDMDTMVRGRGKRSRRHGLSFHGLAEGVEEAVASF